MPVVYSGPLDSPVVEAMFTRLTVNGMLAGRIALADLGDLIKRQAKMNASSGRHPYRTATPAVPGTGPAIISQTLKNSIQRSTVTREIFGWFCQVGTVADKVPPYWAGGKPSNKYGYILEITGCKNGATYPFLAFAAKFGFDHGAKILFTKAYGTAWARIF